MVLVSYIPHNDVSIFQAKLSEREGYEARCLGVAAMPLDQHIAGRHGEHKPGVAIGPDPVHNLCAMADQR